MNKFILFLLLAFLSSCTNKNYKDALYKEKPALYSYILGDVTTPKIDLEESADAYITPASCQKVITSMLALKVLGHDFRYETKLLARKQKDELFDVVLKFSGDPTLNSEKLGALLQKLKSKKIHGKIILDASLFKTRPHSDYINIDDLGKYFARPVSPMIIDENLIHLSISPSKKMLIARVDKDGECKLKNLVVTNEEKTSVKVRLIKEKFIVSGNINIKDSHHKAKISPVELEPYIVEKIKSQMKLLGLYNKISIIYDESDLPKHLEEIASIKSKKIGDIIKQANKISDNLTLDSLYLTMVHYIKPEGVDDWSDGHFIIKELLMKHYNTDIAGGVLIDGSGLSRYNRIQTRKLYELLKQAYADKVFVGSLALPREKDSTLSERKNLPESIVAKTGHLSLVNCLCGYDLKKSKVFVMVASNYAPPVKYMNDVIDNFIAQYIAGD